MEKAFGNREQEVLLAISRLGNQAYRSAILHAVRGPLASEADAGPIGDALLALERQGLVSQAASGAPSENDIRYEITAEGNFMLADKQENLANLRFLVDYRIARYYQRLRSERNSEHKKIFWAGIGWH